VPDDKVEKHFQRCRGKGIKMYYLPLLNRKIKWCRMLFICKVRH